MGYPLPVDDEALSWQKFGVGQTGELKKESDTKLAIKHIWGECERRANDARPRRKVLGIF